MVDEDGDENDGEEEDVGEAIEAPFFVGGFASANVTGSANEVKPVHDIEHGQEDGKARGPHGEAMFRDPPEGDAREIAEKERRVADGREAAPDIGDDEDE